MKLCDECKKQANKELTELVPTLEHAEREISKGIRHFIIRIIIKKSWYPFYYNVDSTCKLLNSWLKSKNTKKGKD